MKGCANVYNKKCKSDNTVMFDIHNTWINKGNLEINWIMVQNNLQNKYKYVCMSIHFFQINLF